jgi:3',5'-cyclic AMP phosphodiesterase CpdA
VTTVLHISDLHFGRPAVSERLESLKMFVADIKPDAVAVSGDLTQQCRHAEFAQARAYLDEIRATSPYIVVPGNHDIRWLGAVARNLGFTGYFRRKAHDFKYSRYTRHISRDLTPSLEIPGAVIAGLNTAHGITRGSLTRRFRDLGVIGHVRHRDIERVKEAFSHAAPDAARIVMIHHNPVRGEISRRHGLANTSQALHAFSNLGAELILCGHDHQEAVHAVEKTAPGLVVSTAGTISNRLRDGRASSFNLVAIDGHELRITTYAWQGEEGFLPSGERSFRRKVATEA